MAAPTVNIVSLGCSKNLVDAEHLMKSLADTGCKVLFDAPAVSLPKGTIVVVNTCGFIADAKEESINTLLQWGNAKESGQVTELIAMGCLSQRYLDTLPDMIPEVDKWFGKNDWGSIVSHLARKNPATAPYDRVVTTPRHHAYLKIAEGCDRFCAFCAIPLITGRYRSRRPEEIIDEARRLASRGVKEFNVIAQDLSAYGRDLNPDRQSGLASLLDSLADIPGIERIRLHYAYPADFPMDILDVMVRRPNVCRYLDIALQHIADPVLNNMRRHIDGKSTRKLLSEIRRRVPGIHIRTTLMVGFPGEGEREFDELMEFVKEQRFERMGAFAYCEEEDTYAARHLNDNIPEEVKQTRLDSLMQLQEQISLEIQERKVGQTLRVVVDREESDYYIGRTEFDSPEVDPEVLIHKTRPLTRGEYINVKVTSALPYDLIAIPV
ncbi:MAG: 30S ribosomal protein S12 methylthiotransferase RimO [Pseudoflavonifractor sp.]|nr:30S ribosomal protein S12 methylthiotransferase RimO [Alloprevotella sp.]MCM1117035.1 30S ribosomal protein S12 methylthiotransferase RimO [Pseudoflavonifractor sp.]